MKAQYVKDNEWIVTDNEGVHHRVFCRSDENTAEAAIAVIVEVQSQEAE